MHRTNIYLTDEQRAVLSARAAVEGVSAAELVRRLIDQALLGGNENLADREFAGSGCRLGLAM